MEANHIAQLLEEAANARIDENSSLEEYEYMKEMLWNLARDSGIAAEVAQIMYEKTSNSAKFNDERV